MSQHRYEEDDELINLVRNCIHKRLSTKEALKMLNEKGRPMHEKTYQRIKKRIEEISKEKIGIIASTERDVYVVKSIEILTNLRDKMLKVAETTDDFWKKLNAYSFVAKIQKELAKFYDAGWDIGEFYKKN